MAIASRKGAKIVLTLNVDEAASLIMAIELEPCHLLEETYFSLQTLVPDEEIGACQCPSCWPEDPR